MASEPANNDWERTKQRLMTRWPALTADELERTHGNREALSGLLQSRLGYAPTNAQVDLDEVLRGRTIMPRDVADEQTHTGSSGPVPNTQVPSGLTSFPNRAAEELAQRGTTEAGEPVEATSGPAGAAGGGPVREFPVDREPGRAQEQAQQQGEGQRMNDQWRQDEDTHARDEMGEMAGLTSMMPMRGMAVGLALVAIAAVAVVMRRRAAKRRRFMGMLGGEMPAVMLAKGARRWGKAAPREVMQAAERMRAA